MYFNKCDIWLVQQYKWHKWKKNSSFPHKIICYQHQKIIMFQINTFTNVTSKNLARTLARKKKDASGIHPPTYKKAHRSNLNLNLLWRNTDTGCIPFIISKWVSFTFGQTGHLPNLEYTEANVVSQLATGSFLKESLIIIVNILLHTIINDLRIAFDVRKLHSFTFKMGMGIFNIQWCFGLVDAKGITLHIFLKP